MGMKERPDTNIMGQKILVFQLYRVLRVLQFLYNIKTNDSSECIFGCII